LTDTPKRLEFTEKKKENIITAIYLGSILIILAIIYTAQLPNSLWNEIFNFFTSLTLSPVGGGIALPAPADLTAHRQLYNAGFQFAIGIGIVEIVILALRIFLNSPAARKAETVENIVFWLGSGYLIVTYLVNITIAAEWFVFWAGIIVVFGLGFVTRAVILMVSR